MKRIVRRIIQVLILLLALCVVLFIRKVFPLINGYAAKTLCSGVFVSQRTTAAISKAELGSFPFNLPAVTLNRQDSSATASILGVFKRKAIYRKGLGATLINDIPETALRNQVFQLSVAPAVDQDTIDWPTGNRLQNPMAHEFDTLSLGPATRAIVIVYKGTIIAEKYAPDFSVGTRQLGWSMTKGIENALLGILVKENKLQIEAPAPINEWQNDERHKITIADLMHMSSGLDYTSSSSGPSDLTDMLFMKDNMPAFAIKAAPEHPPGRVFHYADASANILSFIERRLIGDSAYYRFPYEQLFYKIGMNSALLEVDGNGNFVGSSYCYATARDWARFGLLYLRDGVWNGKRLLPHGWVRFSTSRSPGKNEEKKGQYGALWWLNAADENGIRKYPHVPATCFFCQGYEGQNIWVIPSKELVVVRLALERGKHMDHDAFLADIIARLP